MNPAAQIQPLDVRTLLKRHGVRADKALGQNFLQDAAALEQIANAAEIDPQDTVLEIGPGLGSLTAHLCVRAKQVVAIELDPRLVAALSEVLQPFQNVRVVQGDILTMPTVNLIEQPGYLVVANIPYNITSAILRHLLESEPRPRRLVLTVQKEVAQRICAQPGDLSLLALSVQIYGAPLIVAQIPAASFFPPPKVDSAVLRVDIYDQPLIPPNELEDFFRLIKAGFAQKRKTLRNSLSAGLQITPVKAEAMLRRVGIDAMRRAETLSIAEWRALCGTGAWS